MLKSTTDRMNDYDVVVMGVLEPILVLSVMAVIILFWCDYPGNAPAAAVMPARYRVIFLKVHPRH